MNEKQLIDISIILGVVGIIALFFISGNIELKETPMDKINENRLDEKIRIKGTVKNIVEKEKVSLITLEQSCTIIVVSFDEISVKEGDNVEIIGDIKDYKGDIEVVAEKIRKV